MIDYIFISTTQIPPDNTFLLWSWISSALNHDLLPSILKDVIIALITALIPLSIFLFDPGAVGNAQDFTWDSKVILRQVIKAKQTGLWFFVLFCLLVIWCFLPIDAIRFFLLLPFAYGVNWIIRRFIDCYKWIEDKTNEEASDYTPSAVNKSFRNKCRKAFLSQNKEVTIWQVTWNKEIPNLGAEIYLIEKFIENINDAIKDQRENFISESLICFNRHIANRTFSSYIILEELFPNALKWWDIYFSETDSNALDIKNCIGRLIWKITENAILHGDMDINILFRLFRELKKWTESTTNKKCIIDLLNFIICPACFSNMDKACGLVLSYLWNKPPEGCFPEEWKITTKSLTSEYRYIVDIWCNCFLEWTENKISKSAASEWPDFNFDMVIRGLFPDVNPPLWEMFLVLVIRSNNCVQNPAISLVEQPFKYCSNNRATYGLYPNREYIKEERKQTIELAIHVFEHYLSVEKLDEYIKELNSLMDLSSEKDEQKQDLINVFNEIKRIL